MNNIESSIKNIQSFVNLCIDKEYRILPYSFSARLEHLNKDQKKTAVDTELLKSTDELMTLLRSNQVLTSLVDWSDNPDFLWESTFIETLSAGEKKKYAKFNVLSFDSETYASNPAAYDSELPYFSSIVRYAVLIRYINYLKGLIKIEDVSESALAQEQAEPEAIPVKPVKTEPLGDFESKFEDWQIEILTQCVNEVKIFKSPITAKTMKNILACKLKSPLQVSRYKNKLLAYFFSELDSRSLIARDWQAICARNGLFLSSSKGIVLQQGNYSSAVSQNNEFPPKDCQIIDNYIKQLKRH